MPRVKRLRREFAKRVAQECSLLLQHLKFIDASGVHLGLPRLFGRAAPGQRVVEATPGDSGAHYTLIAALSGHDVQGSWLLEGAMNGAASEVSLEQVLAPTLGRRDIVLMDNLSSHQAARIRQLIEARGARLEFLPPYSPDLNPIDEILAVLEWTAADERKYLKGS